MTTKTSTNQNKLLDNDELEEEFLKCNLEDLPLPIKKLEDFEFEINEVMKSGCNRQIAEYSLLEYESDLFPPEPKDEHEKSKDSIKKTLSELKNEYKKSKKSIKENMPNIDYYINTAKYEKDEKSTYEEEADEIFEENIKEIEGNENYKIEDTDAIKEFIMSDFKSCVEALGDGKDKEIFVKSRENYRDKRDAIIEAALRLVKKIVNDEKEYKKFEEGYKKLQENNNKNN
jgi:hypothetical protein